MTRDAALVVGTWNTHVGIALRNGGLRWLMKRAPQMVACSLQEVPGPVFLRRYLPDGWGFAPAGTSGLDGKLSYVAFDRDRFEFKWSGGEDITHGEKYDRRRATVGLHDRITGRLVIQSSVHVAPLGKGFARAKVGYRKLHEGQVQEYADATAKRPLDAVVIDAGDWNERLAEHLPDRLRNKSAIARMRRAGSFPAHQLAPNPAGPVKLDDLFIKTRPFIEVKRRKVLDPPVRGNDHHAVVTRLRIERDPTT